MELRKKVNKGVCKGINSKSGFISLQSCEGENSTLGLVSVSEYQINKAKSKVKK